MMDIMYNFRYLIAVILAVVIFAIFSWQDFTKTAYALMLQARRKSKELVLESGEAQEAWVVDKIYQFAPRAITIWINRNNMHKVVHWLFEQAKDYLDDGKINKSTNHKDVE